MMMMKMVFFVGNCADYEVETVEDDELCVARVVTMT